MRYDLLTLGISYRRRRPTGVGPIQATLVLIVVAAIALATAWSQIPPEPKDSSVGSGVFSAERALADMEAIASWGPHPTGSQAQQQVREYLVDRLESLGYTPEVRNEFIQSPERGEVVLVKNIVARLEGARSGPALMITAHYDSVWSGPGAMDDASGVAIVLQIAEALRNRSVRNPIVFLLSDGEEMRMLGAKAFVAYNPLAEDVEVVLNLESRGSSGLGIMFETGDGNRELIDLWARAVERPVGSSAYYTFYKQMPNDTDFSIYKDVGMTGLNIANIGTPTNYHTANDSVENANPGTLQHLGDSAMSLALRLADADLESLKGEGDSIFFDVFTRFVVRYPEWLALPLAILALVISLLAWSRMGAMRPERPGLSLVAGSASFVASAVLSLACGLGAIALIRLALPEIPEHGFVGPHALASTAVLSAATAGGILGLALLAGSAGITGLWGGVLIWWNAAVVATTLFLPGVSYLFVLPVIACALGLLVLSFMNPSSEWAYVVALLPGIAVTSILWTPYAGILTLLGGPLTFVPIVPTVILVSVVGPVFAEQRGLLRWITPVALAVAALVFVGLTYWLSV
jgi:hypothetical protein